LSDLFGIIQIILSYKINQLFVNLKTTYINQESFPKVMSDIKRQTAYKCSIKQLNDAKYIQQQGLNPNYITLGNIKASRLNILAILVSKEGNTLTVDDGTSQIQIMLFDENAKRNLPTAGSLIMLIGRPREYNNKRFFVPEIIKQIEDHKWIKHRQKELLLLNYDENHEETTIEETIKIEDEKIINHYETIIKKIKELDKGDGASFQELIKSLKIKNAEKEIEELLKEGEIFEVKGKIKVL